MEETGQEESRQGQPERKKSALAVPCLDPGTALLFVINASAGAHVIDAKRGVIEAALAARGRKGELLVSGPVICRRWPSRPQQQRWHAVRR